MGFGSGFGFGFGFEFGLGLEEEGAHRGRADDAVAQHLLQRDLHELAAARPVREEQAHQRGAAARVGHHVREQRRELLEELLEVRDRLGLGLWLGLGLGFARPTRARVRVRVRVRVSWP